MIKHSLIQKALIKLFNTNFPNKIASLHDLSNGEFFYSVLTQL